MSNDNVLLGALVFACIPALLMFHVWIVDGYNNRVIRYMLVFISSVALLNLMVISYATLVESPVPYILGLVIFPIGSLIIMTIVVHKISKIAPKQKRKAKE